MSTAPTTLPAGWSQILDDVQTRLDHAIALADARIDQMPALQAEPRERASGGEDLARLSAYLDATAQVVQSVDEALQTEETQLRQMQALCGTLRQGLADWAGRAIG